MRKIYLHLMVAVFMLINPVSAQYFSSLYDHPASAGVLNDAKTTFLVTGYSTSHQPNNNAWPDIFQTMLNDHVGNSNTYYVFAHTVGGTPIARWTDICGTGEHVTNAINRYVSPGSSIPQGAPKASIMLAQQSYQWVFGSCSDRTTSISGPNDGTRIRQAAEATQKYMQPFLDAGCNRAYMATHIFKTGSYTTNLWGERFGLAAALDSIDSLFPGPELFDVTQSLFPDGFAADRVHPGPEVAHAMALYWYAVIAGEAAKQSVMAPVAAVAGVPVPEQDITRLSFSPNSGYRRISLSIRPNPFKGVATIRFFSPSERADVSIFDIQGRKIRNFQKVTGSSVTWNARSVSPGVYLIRLETGGKVISGQTTVRQ